MARSSGSWLLVLTDEPPEELHDRARPAYLVELTEKERAGLEFEAATVGADVDERILDLLAEGRTLVSIARELGIARRTVDRRIARLRRDFSVGSSAELAVLSASRGSHWRQLRHDVEQDGESPRRTIHT